MPKFDILNNIIPPTGVSPHGYTPPENGQIVRKPIKDWDTTNVSMAVPYFDQMTQTLLETPEEAELVNSIVARKLAGDNHNLLQEWATLENSVALNDKFLYNRLAQIRYKALYVISQNVQPVTMDPSAFNGLYEWGQSNARVRLAHMVNSGELDHLVDKLENL